jgi:hypothetical protein
MCKWNTQEDLKSSSHKDKSQQKPGRIRQLKESETILMSTLANFDTNKAEAIPYSGYTKPKEIIEQCKIIQSFFPGVRFVNEKLAEGLVSSGAEGRFAIPKWQSVANTYGEAVKMVLDAIGDTRVFKNLLNGFSPEHLIQSVSSMEMFQKLEEYQSGRDILVVAAQFGIRHYRCSSIRACEVMLGNNNEFGLGIFSVGIMLLTHPERLTDFNDVWIDCAGDEYSPITAGNFACTPIFRVDNQKRLLLSADWNDRMDSHCCSASAFI